MRKRSAGAGLVHRLAIGSGSERHVIGVLVAALDLERGDADFADLRDVAERVEIAGREQVARVAEGLDFAVHDHLVGQPAGLRALAAVGAAPAPGLARETLPGVGHAQRAVDEDFEFAIGSLADGAYFGEREFARQRHPVDAETLRQSHAFGRGHAHLRAAVDLQIGRDVARHAARFRHPARSPHRRRLRRFAPARAPLRPVRG